MVAKLKNPGNTSSLSKFEFMCALLTGITGFIYLFVYGIFAPPNGSNQLFPGMRLFVVIVALLCLVAAVGYFQQKRWGWWLHLISGIAQLLFPGTLFELTLDIYHLPAWIGPLVTVGIVFAMRRWRKKLMMVKSPTG